jgi:hypothetical protein
VELMAANVQCTGKRFDDPRHPTRYQLTACLIGPGRRWKGERFVEAATDPALPPKERIKDWWPRTVALRTRKPCPRCGGRVEPIPTEEHR